MKGRQLFSDQGMQLGKVRLLVDRRTRTVVGVAGRRLESELAARLRASVCNPQVVESAKKRKTGIKIVAQNLIVAIKLAFN